MKTPEFKLTYLKCNGKFGNDPHHLIKKYCKVATSHKHKLGDGNVLWKCCNDECVSRFLKCKFKSEPKVEVDDHVSVRSSEKFRCVK